EDLYLPFKKKRKTKADAAREAGLEPLARILLAQKEENIRKLAHKYLNRDITTIEEALQGAKNIVAEWINENQDIRSGLRRLYTRESTISSKGFKQKVEVAEFQKYQQYFEWQEALNKMPSHRFLAMYRAEQEKVVKLKVGVEKEKALKIIEKQILTSGRNTSCRSLVIEAIDDAFTRLLKPSFQSEMLSNAKIRADEEAIRVFAGNLEQLLLSAPLGPKRILAIDPGFKSGCKVVCLDEQGSLIHNENIYPHAPQKEIAM